MNIDTVKIELINWISQLEDQSSVRKLLNLKNRLMSSKPEKEGQKIFVSGKKLIKYVADDFNEPLDVT